MRRRSFFGALFAGAAAPVVAKALESIPEQVEDAPQPELFAVEKHATGPTHGFYDCTMTCWIEPTPHKML